MEFELHVLGIGIDIADPERLARVRRKGDVMRQVMAPAESHFLPLSDANAARIWATKEAIAKSLGTGFWQRGMAWTDIRFKPDWTVELFGAAAELAASSDFSIETRFEGRYLIVTCLRTRSMADHGPFEGKNHNQSAHG